MPSLQTSGFKLNLPTVDALPLAKMGALQGFDPATFAFDMISPYINGLKAGKEITAPITEALKTFDPEVQAEKDFNKKLREFKVEQFPIESKLSRLNLTKAEQEADIGGLKNAWLKSAYGNLGTGGTSLQDFQLGPNGDLAYTPAAEADRQKKITMAKRTPEDLEKDQLEIKQKKLELSTAEALNDPATKAKLAALDVEDQKNAALLNEYQKLKNAGTPAQPGLSTTPNEFPHAADAVPVPVDPYASIGKPPAMTLTRFDPATAGFKTVENPAYKIYEGRIKALQDTEEAGRKKALEAGMPDAMTASIGEVAKYIKGGGLDPILQAKASASIDAISKIEPLLNGWATGGTGNMAKHLPWPTEASTLRAQLEVLKSQLSTSELLKMKAAGASFGALSDKELSLLGNSIASIDPNNLNLPALKSSIADVKTAMEKISRQPSGSNAQTKLAVDGSITAPGGVVIKRLK